MIEIIPEIGNIDKYQKLAEKFSLGFEYNDFFEPELLDDCSALQERIRQYKSLLRPRGIDTMHGAFYDIVPFSWDSGIRRHSFYRMQQSVDIAEQLGCRGVVFHAGLKPAYAANERYYRNWLETMADVARKLLEQSSTTEIYFENVLETSPAELKELAEGLKDEKRFGICLDIAHMMLVDGAEAEQWLRELAPFIRHFHINDNHRKTDEHLALGDGDIDWTGIFRAVERYGLKDRSMLLEVKGLQRTEESLEYLRRRSWLAE